METHIIYKGVVEDGMNTKFPYVTVEYEDKADGKTRQKKFSANFDKAVVDTFTSSVTSVEDEFLVDIEKDAKGYWKWVGIRRPGDPRQAAQAAPAKGTYSKPAGQPASGTKYQPRGGNFETPEERAYRQVMIVRQSSLGHAIEMLALTKKAADVEDVVKIAAQFEAWVLRKD